MARKYARNRKLNSVILSKRKRASAVFCRAFTSFQPAQLNTITSVEFCLIARKKFSRGKYTDRSSFGWLLPVIGKNRSPDTPAFSRNLSVERNSMTRWFFSTIFLRSFTGLPCRIGAAEILFPESADARFGPRNGGKHPGVLADIFDGRKQGKIPESRGDMVIQRGFFRDFPDLVNRCIGPSLREFHKLGLLER